MKFTIIGGTMESKFALEYVATKLQELMPGAQISTYTYGFAMKHKDEINKAINGRVLITHSTGAMVMKSGANPVRAIFISPSQPISRAKLLLRAATKTLVHSWKIFSVKPRRQVLRILASNVFEMIVHPVLNLKPFITGDVSRFDLRKILPRHPVAGETRIIISSHDEMFAPNENIFDELEAHGVDLVHVDAMHDEIFLDTERILSAALKR